MKLFTAGYCNPCKELKAWIAEMGFTEPEIIDTSIDFELARELDIKMLPTLAIKNLNGYQLLEGREKIKPYLRGLHDRKSKVSDT